MAKLKRRSLEDFKQDPNNPNRGTDAARQLIGESLRELGFGRSIVADRNGTTICGNQTLRKCLEEGMAEAVVVESDGKRPVVIIRTDLEMGDGKAEKLSVADNRCRDVGVSWDAARLEDLLEDIDLEPFFPADEIFGDDGFEPVTEDEQGRLDEKKLAKCPECGHEFDPSKAA